uniref:Uncharacterized protein n=1 Tax=Siphoviridae sp. ctZHD14 TaxID=2827891 RepID=A0A8S5SW78_9CAUD|nr:MAG TPA: Protein of unknown function (DUF1040) [Siphoviridae sp. ctZHD14]
MRDPERISKILDDIEEIWLHYPDMRFGQLVTNFVVQGCNDNFFYQEDDITQEKLKRTKELF